MKFLLSIFSFFLALCSWSQNKVVLQIDPVEVEEGVPFVISVKSEVDGMMEIDNLPGSFQGAGVSKMSNYHIDHTTGQAMRSFEFQQNGIIAKKGTYTIGPAWIKNGNKTYKSNTVTISVKDKVVFYNGGITAKQLQDPAFGVVQINKPEIYEGEAVLTSAKVYAKFEPTGVPSYQEYVVQGTIEKHPASSRAYNNWTIETMRGKEYVVGVVDKQIVFPSGTGNVHIDPFSMILSQGFNSFKVVSSPAIIKVKPLPVNPPKDFIGAVGEFKIIRELDSSKIKQGDVISMKIIVEGTGNVQNSLEPVITLPKGFTVYGDPSKEDNIGYNSMGATGTIIYEYNIQVNEHGKVPLPPTTISFFDVKQEKYVQAESSWDTLVIKKNKKFNLPKEEPQEEIAEGQPVLRSTRDKKNTTSFYGSTAFWAGVGSPILASLFFLFFTKTRKNQEEKEAKKAIIREKVQAKTSALSEAEKLVNSDSKEFYSKVEEALKKGFEEKMNWSKEARINQSDVFAYLKQSNQAEIADKVKRILEECASAQYGFGQTQNSRTELLNSLKSVLKQLK